VNARDLIKKHEGLRLKAYPDPGTGGAPWTIGYGHTGGVKRGDTITQLQADHYLDDDMAEAFACVDSLVTVSITDKQRGALCSFVFNVGCGAFKKSTLLRLLNAGDYTGAAAQFPRWNKSAGNILPGLVRRRGEERALFLSGTDIPEPAFPQETEMAPFLAVAIPALISALPEFARIFNKPDVAERNVEAVVKASEIVMQATGATNVQEAVEKVQASPEIAETANEALRMNRAELMDTLERAWDKDEASIAAARQFSREDRPIIGNWLFVHILSILLVTIGGGAAIGVLFTSADPTERAMALQALLLVGFASVVAFWLGSSRSSQVKDLVRER